MVKAALPPANMPFIDRNGMVNPEWYRALNQILARTGGTAEDLIEQSLRVTGAGIVVATGTNPAITRSIASGTGINVTNGDGISGNPTVALANTAVTPSSYGSATSVATFTVDQQGRLTAAANAAISFPVTSVFGRTGAVTAQNNDYTFAQIGSKPTTLAGYGITDAVSSSLTSANILVGNGSNVAAAVAVSGDATLANTGALTVTKTGGVAFAASATTDATNASNISSGTLALARGGTGANLGATGGTSQVLKQASAGAAVTVGQLSAADLSDYTTGTWTPSLGGTATYNSRSGTYTAFGRLVFQDCNMDVNTIGTGSQSAISGLPFAARVGPAASQAISFFAGLASSVVRYSAYIASGSSVIGTTSLAAAATSVTNLPNLITSGTVLFVSGSYEK